jgi:hypothetical protein
VAVITPREGVLLDLISIPQAVKDAGFTPGDLYIKVWGTYVQTVEGLQFRIPGQGGQSLQLPVEGVTIKAEELLLLKAKVLYANDQLVLVPVERP